MGKVIDPVDIKAAIKRGQLEVIVKKSLHFLAGKTDHYCIYIRDSDNGDTVLIKEWDE